VINRRCTCHAATADRCDHPFCTSRRCGRCHVCRLVAADPLLVLTPDEQRFLEAWNQLPNHTEQERLSAAETRLVFKLADMGLVDA